MVKKDTILRTETLIVARQPILNSSAIHFQSALRLTLINLTTLD